jgi:DNA-binding NarL/FixJ family response regulator
MRIRVLIADDQAMVRAGLRLILESRPDLVVVAEAADGEEAVAAARRHLPDVILMDVRMPRLDGIEATRQITSEPHSARVLVLNHVRRGRIRVQGTASRSIWVPP